MSFTRAEWFQIAQFLILPALWWMTKFAVKEIKGAIDERADKIATRRMIELKTMLLAQFAEHETNDTQRFNSLTSQIDTLQRILNP